MAATVPVVEDDRKLRELVHSCLEWYGFAGLSAGSGAEALTPAARMGQAAAAAAVVNAVAPPGAYADGCHEWP